MSWHYGHHDRHDYLYHRHTSRHARAHHHPGIAPGHHSAKREQHHLLHVQEEPPSRRRRHGHLRRQLGNAVTPEAPVPQAYAAPEQPNPIAQFFSNIFHPGAPAAAPSYAPAGNGVATPAGTATYDIRSGKVYMPDGSCLEAHSGLGAGNYDNPASAAVKNRGVTPPGLYRLDPRREGLFHGVEALRLTPVGGTDTHGRNGLLTHTPMLRGAAPDEPGASNGCVSFSQYQEFLHAYKAGGVRFLQVVGDGPAPHATRNHEPHGRHAGHRKHGPHPHAPGY